MKKILLLFIPFFFLLSPLKAQIISTFAGNYSFGAGYSGDGGPATDAQFFSPVDVTFDRSGNLYVADRTNNVVRMVNTSGIITTIAGNGHAGFHGDGGQATAAELSDDVGILVDSLGNMYISEEGNERIRKVNTSGIITTIAGNGVLGFSGDGGLATAAELFSPGFMAIDKKDNLLFADAYNNVIRRIDTSGIITTIVGNHVVGYSGDGGQASLAELNIPEGVALDKNGNLIIGDADNYVVRKVDTSGIISTIAGNHHLGFSGDGGPSTAAELNQPCGIILDASGTIYFADESNNVIRTINGSGIIHNIAGNYISGYSGDGGLASGAEMDLVSAGAFNASGNLFLADEYNNVIREVTGVTTGSNQYSTSNSQVMVYPNPNEGVFTIQISAPSARGGITNVEIYNVLGEKVYSSNFPQATNHYSLDLSNQPSGIYFYRVQQESGELIGEGKVLIQK